ncbi:MAG: TonB-dependent receptor [Betaproteobacteria bacterium]|nr:TonB-dependent receptor [Betaproteobacteria bacterium]
MSNKNLHAATVPGIAVLHRRRATAGWPAGGGAVAVAAMAAALLCVAPAGAQQVALKDLADLSLEELSNITVTSVSGNAEPLSGAAASIYVITGEDIRRSAATSLPEALRLAPNLQVARIDARNYAVTARGSNGAFSNKLLVLIDGRIVYTPLFSGVFWDAQDVMLEDVERIEVISGPGGTLWGSNAVNGVINVITRSAADTQGGLLAAGTSGRETDTAMRYGGTLSNGGHYRIYGKHADYDDTRAASGAQVFDGWRRDQVGFRADWGGGADAFTLQGDAYRGKLHQALTSAIQTGGANLTGHWNRRFDDGAQLRVAAYFDHTDRSQPGAFVENLDTASADLQYAFKLGAAHQVTLGGGYRASWDRLENTPGLAFLPAALNMHWGNVFAQDEIALTESLRLTAGAKVETNSYTGAEFLPSLRLAWRVTPQHLLWSAVSRAVRAPSRIDRDLYVPAKPILTISGVPIYLLAGGPNFVSEVAKVYEVGYRGQPAAAFTYSVTAFYQHYDKLRNLQAGLLGLNLAFDNTAIGSVGGVEMWGSWQVTRAWRLSGGFVGQHTGARPAPDAVNQGAALSLGNDPSRYWTLRSSLDIGDRQELDVSVRHMGALPTPAVPAYTAVDLRYGWRVRPNVQAALIVQNLFDPRHPEFGTAPGYSEIGRNIFAKLNISF